MDNGRIGQLLKNLDTVKKEINDYVLSNEDWIYYFLNPKVKIGNTDLFDCVENHPLNYDDYISLDIEYVNGTFMKVCINVFDDPFSDVPKSSLTRYIFLPKFDETVKRNKLLYSTKLELIKINGLKDEIQKLKDKLKEREMELETLEREYCNEDE